MGGKNGPICYALSLSLYLSPPPSPSTMETMETSVRRIEPTRFVRTRLLFGIFNASHLLRSLNLSIPLDDIYKEPYIGINQFDLGSRPIRPILILIDRRFVDLLTFIRQRDTWIDINLE